jgi:hypothetical protein
MSIEICPRILDLSGIGPFRRDGASHPIDGFWSYKIFAPFKPVSSIIDVTPDMSLRDAYLTR